MPDPIRKQDNTAPATANAVAAQQERTTAKVQPPATPANAGMMAALDAVNASATPLHAPGGRAEITDPRAPVSTMGVGNVADTQGGAAGSGQVSRPAPPATGGSQVVRPTYPGTPGPSGSPIAPTGTQVVQQGSASTTPQSPSPADAAQEAVQQAQAAGAGLNVQPGNLDANATLQNIIGMLNQLLGAQSQAANNQVDYSVQQGVNELQRAEEDAQQGFRDQQHQINIDERKALDNAALYAEARGDRGGIGQTQYTEIQLNAAKNRLAVNQAQQKLSTDTARQIADLRAQGEFNKADALLNLTQQYLSSLMSSYQWAVQLGLSYDQYLQELDQWQKNYEINYANITGMLPDGSKTLALQKYEDEQASTMGAALLKAGVMPSPEQLAAMGLSREQALDYIAAQGLQLRDTAGNSSSGAGTGTGGEESTTTGGNSGTGSPTGSSGNGDTATGGSTPTINSLGYDTHGYTPGQIKDLQHTAGIAEDGVWGPQTEAAYKAGYRPGGAKGMATGAIFGGSQVPNLNPDAAPGSELNTTNRSGVGWVYIQGLGRVTLNELKSYVENYENKATTGTKVQEISNPDGSYTYVLVH